MVRNGRTPGAVRTIPAMRVGVVTGAGTGIGRAVAEQLGARGVRVVGVGRTRATLDDMVASIRAAGGGAEAVVADCATAAGVADVVGAVGGREVAALVHAAGADLAAPFATTDRVAFDTLVGVNLAAPFFLTQALLGRFADGAGVVFVGSVSARTGRDRHAAYGASKAGLIGLTVNLAVELAPRVRVNSVSPGATDTRMLAAYVAESTKGLTDDQQRRTRIADASRMLLRRVATPAEVAATVVHLALDATAVTGVDVPVDVGYSAT